MVIIQNMGVQSWKCRVNSKFEWVKLQMSHLRELLPSQKVKVNPAAKMEEKWFLLLVTVLITSIEIGKPNPTSHNSHKLCEVWTVGTRKIQSPDCIWLPDKYFDTLLIKIFMTSTFLPAEFWGDPTPLPCHGPVPGIGVPSLFSPSANGDATVLAKHGRHLWFPNVCQTTTVGLSSSQHFRVSKLIQELPTWWFLLQDFVSRL